MIIMVPGRKLPLVILVFGTAARSRIPVCTLDIVSIHALIQTKELSLAWMLTRKGKGKGKGRGVNHGLDCL